jgi:hypothetical protein
MKHFAWITALAIVPVPLGSAHAHNISAARGTAPTHVVAPSNTSTPAAAITTPVMPVAPTRVRLTADQLVVMYPWVEMAYAQQYANQRAYWRQAYREQQYWQRQYQLEQQYWQKQEQERHERHVANWTQRRLAEQARLAASRARHASPRLHHAGGA